MVTISGAILVSLSRLFHNSNNSESDNTLPACVPQFLEARGSQRGVSKTRGRGRGLFFFFLKNTVLGLTLTLILKQHSLKKERPRPRILLTPKSKHGIISCVYNYELLKVT